MPCLTDSVSEVSALVELYVRPVEISASQLPATSTLLSMGRAVFIEHGIITIVSKQIFTPGQVQKLPSE